MRYLLLLYCVVLTQGSNPNTTTTPTVRKTLSCNDTVLTELDECWNKLPEVSYHGIPTNPEKIENACNVFISGMECVDTWSKTCLSSEAQEMLESSIIGAMQVYKLLCTNSTFRGEFLLHSNCYTRTSPYLDACNHQFIDTLDRIDHANDKQSLCCVRLRYIQCVDEVGRVLCSKNATSFLRKITKFLMQTTMRTYHQCQCTDVDYKKCTSVKSAARPSTEIVIVSNIYSIYQITFYFPCWQAIYLSLLFWLALLSP